ncbi:MAG: neutral/alkaline non-lysosomal ceramidase N-terminal domain-containing protein [Candidatus Lernaella stagnicola]|nr:neutral/alkaline non-lysosomal ceramidase N-terminal domain-containing protein [Candidatus Lernaella stagnicola]
MKRTCFVALLVMAMVMLGSGAPTPAGQAALFQVGMAKVDLTPDPQAMSITLNGYAGRGKQPATGVLDPIYARAMVITDPGKRELAILAMDLCFVNSEVRDMAVARLEPHGFGEHNLMITATHTHAAPSAYDRRWITAALMGPFDEAILNQVVDGIVTAVLEAKRKQQPAQIQYDVSELADMNRSRRDPAFDVAVGTVEGVKPNPEKYQTDRRLTVFHITTPEGKPLGALVHFASHPTVLSPDNLQISADWPGVMNREIEKQLGENTVSMFVNGALGDAAPTPDWSTPEQEIKDTEKYGSQMAAAVIARLPQTKPLRDAVVAGFTNRAVFDQVELQPLGGMPMHRGFSRVVYLRPDQPFQAVRLGHFVILGAPGEPTTLAARSLETLCNDGFHCLTAGPVNGYMGYFATPAVYDEGGYAAGASFWGRDTVMKIKKALQPAAMVVQSDW